MYKLACVVLVILGSFQISVAQDFSNLWEAHFSYYNVIDVISTENSIYAAADNAIFKYDTTSNTIETLTTINGLSGQEITALHYSNDYQSLLIGYGNGLIELYSETNATLLPVIDIVERRNIQEQNKGINSFYENDGLVYIATDFGVSVYNLDASEFGDTYFLGNGGTQISVQQVAVNNNTIYAACLNNNGVKSASLSNPNLIDYTQWNTVAPGNYASVSAVNTNVYAVRSDRAIINIVTNTTVVNLSFSPIDIKQSEDNLVFTSPNRVEVYDSNLVLTNTLQPNNDFNTSFNSAIIFDSSVYIGTQNFGMLKSDTSLPNQYTEIRPNGPLENAIFKLNATSGTVWATYGEYSQFLNPFPLTAKGISIYDNGEWKNTPFDSLQGAVELNEIAVNPMNSNQVFVSSFHRGILEFNNLEPTVLYNEDNSGLETILNSASRSIRVSGLKFDNQGLLWSTTSLVDRVLKSYDPSNGTWSAYSFSGIIEDPFDEAGFFDLEIDNNGTKWIGSFRTRLIGYNENLSNPVKVINASNDGVDPFTTFRALAVDNNNQLWVGTNFGLRVLFNATGFFDDPNPELSPIIILEDGLAQELLDGQAINAIKVDGSNNKWIGTTDSGVFYLSPDGQNTIYHFTTENSPLPSNNIRDISIAENDGTVYIATQKGLVAFTAGGTSPSENLNNAYVYPNPVRPEYNILGFNDLNDITKGVKIMGLTNRVNVKITDIEGNLVAEAQSGVNLRANESNNLAIDGGTAVWNGKNLANNIVRSGVYLVLINDLVTFETNALKVLIIR